MSKNPIYLDYAATTPINSAVLDAMLPYYGVSRLSSQRSHLSATLFGNPGSLHSFGQQASAAVFVARQMIAKELNCHYSEIIFTGSATEANNLALRGALKAYRLSLTASGESVHPRVIISAIEHESVLATANDLEKEGVEVVIIPVSKEGVIDLKKLKAALNERTVIVSVMSANNEVGVVQPIAEIAKLINDFKSSVAVSHKSLAVSYPLFHTDAAQAFQYMKCDVEAMGVDLLTISAHKIYGPKGIGCLYVRRTPGFKSLSTNYCLLPIITGGGQEFGVRSGTENVPAIVGFAKAISLVAMDREDEAVRVAKLRDQVWVGIKKIFPRATMNGSYKNRLPNNLNVYIPGVSGEQLLVALDLEGIAASSGSACTARSTNPSHVLLALGCDVHRAKNSLRFTLGRMTTPGEIKRFLTVLKKVKENLDR